MCRDGVMVTTMMKMKMMMEGLIERVSKKVKRNDIETKIGRHFIYFLKANTVTYGIHWWNGGMTIFSGILGILCVKSDFK